MFVLGRPHIHSADTSDALEKGTLHTGPDTAGPSYTPAANTATAADAHHSARANARYSNLKKQDEHADSAAACLQV